MIDERTLVADIKSYIDKLPNFEAKVEEHTEQRKRFDLKVYYNKNILFTGEFKKPTSIEGRTPRNANLVLDAYAKANSNMSTLPKYFITSNFNETIIWDNTVTDRPLMDRHIMKFELPTLIKNDDDFLRDEIKNEIYEMIKNLCNYILDLYQGKIRAVYKPLGESFILGLNETLKIISEVSRKYIDLSILRKWLKEQGIDPTLYDEDTLKDRMIKYVTYVFANKIVFYLVLRKYFQLPDLKPSDDIDINDLKRFINESFEEAKKVSQDYETVFLSDPAEDILFKDNEQVYHLISLLKFLTNYDFSGLNQDILGNIYDRLISPEERHNYGQYYTPIPVVDLINALTIKDANARVMDPACGSGTFLSRAFELKLKLIGEDNKEIREQLLTQIFGCDIAPYPAHLATISLASKLVTYNPDVYPNIIRSDFFDISPTMIVPKVKFVEREKIKTIDLSGNIREINFKPIDAFVSNLPYIRDEDLNKVLGIKKEDEQKKIENFLKNNSFSADTPESGSDFHVYFWYYILPFLKEGSRVGFLTSDTWLNVEYGDSLKKFINKYFKIIAIIDSSVERWFEDALVNTVITILERTRNEEERKNNKIKFVRINKKISDLIHDLNDAIKIAQDIEKGISKKDVTITRKIRQGDLNFNDVMKAKLFPYLRAPDEFFKLINNENMIPLKNVMSIQRGFTTGANDFFYVIDVTDKYKVEELKKKWNLRRGELKNLRIIKSGDGSEHLIEKEYLRPVLKSPREFTNNGKLIFNGPTKYYVVLIDEKDENKIKPYARKYLEYGEKNPIGEPYSKRPTCKGRARWWDLKPIIYPDLVFTMYFSSNFVYPKTNILLDHTMYFGKMKDNCKDDLLTVYSFMNSSLSYLYPDLLGRTYGGGAVGFMVYEVKNFPVPNPEIMRSYYDDLSKIMNKMENREIGTVFEEIWDGNGNFDLSKVKEDRLELDRTILKALGYTDLDKFLIKWYPLVVKTVKERLEKARSVGNKKNVKKVSLEKIAKEIIKDLNIKKFPEDYVDEYTDEILQINEDGEIGLGNDLNGLYVSIGNRKIYIENKFKQKYIYYNLLIGNKNIKIAKNMDEAINDYENDLKDWKKIIIGKINEITDDEFKINKIFKICVKLLNLEALNRI